MLAELPGTYVRRAKDTGTPEHKEMRTMDTKHLTLAALPLAAAALLGAHATASATTPPPGCFTIPACEYAPATPAGFTTPAETAPHLRGPAASLRFMDIRDQSYELDVGERGASPGDTLFFNNLLRGREDGRDAGRFASRCSRLPGDLFHCQGTLLLSGSTIEVATTTDLAAPITASVTGGTGAYEAAAGQVRITPTANPGRSRLDVHLTSRDHDRARGQVIRRLGLS
jgi:hypothetical protein